MTTQNYLIIDLQNIVENIVLWDGGPDWEPPSGYLALPQSTTPAMIWRLDKTENPPVFKLTEVVGVGDLGFIWNGTVLTTDEPQPTYTPPTKTTPVTNPSA